MVTPLLVLDGFTISDVYNVAVSGQTTVNMLADEATQVYPLWRWARQNYLIAWEGTNDLRDGATATQAYDNLVLYYSNGQTAGFQCVAMTILPRTGQPLSFETRRIEVNNNLRANWPSFSDALADVAADPRLSDPNNTTYFSDGTHLTAAGNAVVAEIVANALATIMTP